MRRRKEERSRNEGEKEKENIPGLFFSHCLVFCREEYKFDTLADLLPVAVEMGQGKREDRNRGRTFFFVTLYCWLFALLSFVLVFFTKKQSCFGFVFLKISLFSVFLTVLIFCNTNRKVDWLTDKLVQANFTVSSVVYAPFYISFSPRLLLLLASFLLLLTSLPSLLRLSLLSLLFFSPHSMVTSHKMTEQKLCSGFVRMSVVFSSRPTSCHVA